MQYLLLGVEGVLTFISPCLLPMLPIYLAYITGSSQGQSEKSKQQLVIQALLFVLGFSLVFVVMGIFVNSIGRFVLINRTVIHWIAGGFMIILGLDYLLENPLLNRMTKFPQIQAKQTNALLLGMVFSISWTPCVGTFLASALSYAATSQSYLESIGLLLSYSIGLAIPFILSALLIQELQGALQWIKTHYKQVRIISGMFLILMGCMTLFGWMESLLIYLS